MTVTNIDTGDQRVVVTNESGLYRAPLLSLGTYRVTAELQGFKKFEQTGVSLRAGQMAVIDVELGVGALTETISVTADAPVVDLAKIEQGRTLSEAEIKTLPLTSRNPYNFALLQPGVVGFETQEFGVPRLTANGALLRVNYQIDGNNNTQKDRAGLRQMPMSEVMIREVKVVTTGYAPEFGQTMGLVYNAITPSGTNTFKGQGSYRFQRRPIVALPFFTPRRRAEAADRRQRLHGRPRRSDREGPDALLRRLREHRARSVGRPRHHDHAGQRGAARARPSRPTCRAACNTKFAIGKIDHQSERRQPPDRALHLLRQLHHRQHRRRPADRCSAGTDFTDRQHSTGGAAGLDVRRDDAERAARAVRDARADPRARTRRRAPARRSASPASPTSAARSPADADAGFGFTQNIFQVDNITTLLGNHASRPASTCSGSTDTRVQTQLQLYTFPNVGAYLAARRGANRFGYTTFQQFFGLPDLDYNTVEVRPVRAGRLAPVVRPEGAVRPALRRLRAARRRRERAGRDLARVPDVDEQHRAARRLRVDARRDRRTVLRANTGLMYDQPINAIYEQAMVNDGTNARAAPTCTPTQAGAPAFPAVLPPAPARRRTWRGPSIPTSRSRACGRTTCSSSAASASTTRPRSARSYMRGYNLPVVTNINLINPIGTLPDGRPILRHGDQRGDPRRSALQRRSSACRRSANRRTRA